MASLSLRVTRDQDGLYAIARLQLLQEPTHTGFDCPLGGLKPMGDLLVHQALQ
jgi:hypothetical protein